MSQIQASPFGPLHFYDAPEVALTQIMDDEATFGSFVNTFFSPDTLSPIERDSYADRMKEQLGYDKKGVGSALVDVATNPLVCLPPQACGWEDRDVCLHRTLRTV